MAGVAVVGLGAMGSRIARRLVDAGHDVVVWNRDAAKAAPLVEAGARAAASPADAAREAEAVLVMVSDAGALRDVAEGPAGILAGLGDSTLLIQMSTVGVDGLAQLRSIVPDASQLLDAPVLGSLAEAESGALKVFAGGPVETVERATPLLSALGSVLHVGELGAGTAAKLIANASLFAVLGVLGEGLALARGLGLEQEIAFEVLAATPLAAQVERRRPAVESRRYPTRFALTLAVKDLELVREAAAATGTELRIGAATRSWFADAAAHGLGDLDYAAVLARILGDEAS